MTIDTSTARDEAQVRECIDGWARALRGKDVDGVMSHYTPDILTFDLAPPLQHVGEAYRRGFEEWFRTFRGPIGLEIRQLKITVGADVAFSHSINHISGARTSGEDTDIWVRATVCFRKIDGRWMAAHEHVSVPFYMDGSFRAAVDLRP
jgi:ketosteroid isomerase-like protein